MIDLLLDYYLIQIKIIKQKIKNCRIQIKVANPIEHIYAIVGVILSQNHYISITDENASFINGLYDDEVYIITDDEPKIANEYNIQTLLNHALEKDLEWFSYDENAFLCSFVTSGSTGKPKLVQHTHKNTWLPWKGTKKSPLTPKQKEHNHILVLYNLI